MPDSFAHLHVHSEWSLLDGTSRVKALAEAAAADGEPALALTDHGSLYGAVELAEAYAAEGVKPVFGTEAYLAVRDGDPAAPTDAKDRFHLLLLAVGPEGWRSLSRLSSRASLEGHDGRRPCVDLAMLAEDAAGLVATTACIGGVVPQCLLAGDFAGAEAWAGALRDIFGPEGFYAEVQSHGIPEEVLAARELVGMARRMGIPLLATNDSHYTAPGDAEAHNAFLCVQTGAAIADEKRFRFQGSGYHLKTAAEMRALFAELPEACDATLAIAERVEAAVPFAPPRLPDLATPDGSSQPARLRRLVWAGAKRRYGDPLPDKVVAQIREELEVVEEMGFSGYFLVVEDLVSWARSHGVQVGPGRGSASGSILMYCLGVTDLEPFRFGLIFARFINRGRKKSLPDADLDFFPPEPVIAYARERYGVENVARIATFSTIQARTAVRDAARVLGFPYSVGDRIAKEMPPVAMGRATPLAACLERTEGHEAGWAGAQRLRDLVAADADAALVVETALALEGLKRSAGVHAAGVVVSDRPLADVIPLQRPPGKDPGAGKIALDGLDDEAREVLGRSYGALPVTQYDMWGVEKLGLVKLDCLGLRTLGVHDAAVRFARATGAECPGPEEIPTEDEATFELLRSGATTGVFQLESPPVQALLREMVPDRLDDIIALVALYRPGPMAFGVHHAYCRRKNGLEPVTSPVPEFAEVLADTHGLLVYQEQLMAVAAHYAGYSLVEADDLRKACGKKIREVMEAQEEKFVAGCARNGYGEEVGKELFKRLLPFSDYGFNKAHSGAYGVLAVRSAWLKAHFPEAFWAAQIGSVTDDRDALAHYVAAAREEGVAILGPDVNASQAGFAVERRGDGLAVRFGLQGVRGVGEGAARRVVVERESGGGYASPDDFCRRLAGDLRSDSLASLAFAGALDALGDRAAIGHGAKALCEEAKKAAQREAMGSLFDLAEWTVLPPVPAGGDDPAVLLEAEHAALGVYVSGHPLDPYRDALGAQGVLDAGLLDESADGRRATVCGIVREIVRKTTRKGSAMLLGRLEGVHGSVGLVAWEEQGEDLASAGERPLVVRGRAELREDRLQIRVSEVFYASDCALAEDAPGKSGGGEGARAVVEVRADPGEVDEEWLRRLGERLAESPGDAEVLVRLGTKRISLGEARRADRERLVGALRGEGFDVVGV